jgi:ketosteroid isomerase-like protein
MDQPIEEGNPMIPQAPTNSEETEIRTLIERWFEAVSARRIDDILADHSADIVMFDVSPPIVCGIDAYRDSWLRMFPWLGEHGLFESTELTIITGEDVAFCFGLLRCQSSVSDSELLSIRLTIGLRKRDRRWIVEHEHHSEASSQ